MTPKPHRKVNPASSYLRTRVMSASPAELRLMLLDGAIKFAGRGRGGLERRDVEAAYDGISRTQQILVELINALQPDQAPDLCQRLQGLYTFMYTRLIEASRERSAAIVDEIIQLLTYERETWDMAMQKLAEEQGTAPPALEESAPAGGTVSVKG
jgi:flagellar protein FliS